MLPIAAQQHASKKYFSIFMTVRSLEEQLRASFKKLSGQQISTKPCFALFRRVPADSARLVEDTRRRRTRRAVAPSEGGSLDSPRLSVTREIPPPLSMLDARCFSPQPSALSLSIAPHPASRIVPIPCPPPHTPQTSVNSVTNQ